MLRVAGVDGPARPGGGPARSEPFSALAVGPLRLGVCYIAWLPSQGSLSYLSLVECYDTC